MARAAQPGPLTPLIRPARIEDAAGLCQLLGVLGYPCTVAEAEERVLALREDVNQTLLVADWAGVLAGLVCCDVSYYLPLGAATCRITALAAECPKILYAIGAQLSKRLLDTSRKASRLAFLDVAGRIARTLDDLTREPDAMSHPQGTQIRVSRQELARIVGCSREMAGRVLKQLQEQGKLHARGKTVVVYGTR
jgi:hypothetical protein